MEVIIHAQQYFNAAVIAHKIVLESLAAQMHVRKETEKSRIIGERALHFHSEIIGVGRDDERVVIQLESDDALLGSALGKHDANAGLILIGGAVAGVVHLK